MGTAPRASPSGGDRRRPGALPALLVGLCLLLLASRSAAAAEPPPEEEATPAPVATGDGETLADGETGAEPASPVAKDPFAPDCGPDAVALEFPAWRWDPDAFIVGGSTTRPVTRSASAWPLHGSIGARYRVRATEDDQDHVLYQYLRLDYRDEWSEGLSGSFHGRLTEDFNHRHGSTSFHPLASILDGYGGPVNGRIYHLYGTWRAAPGTPIETVRLGRQYVDAGEIFWVDGLRAETQPLPFCGAFQLSAFAGVPVHLFEGSMRGDWIVGAGVRGEPWRGTQIGLHYVHIQDESRPYGDVDNDLVSLSVRQSLGRNASVRALYQHLDEDPRLLHLGFDAFLEAPRLFVRGSFRSILHRQSALAFDLDPYTVLLQRLEPYWEGHLSVMRPLNRCWDVEAGATVRMLFDEDDESRYNREFQRFFLNLSATDWPRPHWSVFLNGELWTGDDTIATVGFEVAYKPSPCWRARLGSDYQLYRTDFFADRETIDSRSVYADVRWQPNRTWRFEARLRLESDDFDETLTADLGATFFF